MDRPLRCRDSRAGYRYPALAASCLLMALLMVAPAIAAAAGDPDDASIRRWGFGWDPGESGQGLTLRYRFTPAFNLSVAGGPDDYRSDAESYRWDSDDMAIDDGNLLRDDDRREQGWVRLTGGYRFWQQDHVSLSAIFGTTYRWSNEEDRYREFRSYSGQTWDYSNRRDLDDITYWTYTLGVRPSWEAMTRLHIEFEAGIRFQRTTYETVSETWWDSFPETTRDEQTRHTRTFSSYGGFEWYRLKFIFWF